MHNTSSNAKTKRNDSATMDALHPSIRHEITTLFSVSINM
jgi:hypothetical protein